MRGGLTGPLSRNCAITQKPLIPVFCGFMTFPKIYLGNFLKKSQVNIWNIFWFIADSVRVGSPIFPISGISLIKSPTINKCSKMAKNACIMMKFGKNMYFDINVWFFSKNTKFAHYYPDFSHFPDFADFADFCRFWTKIKENWQSVKV